MEGTIGEVRLFAGFFTPRNWLPCEGQLLEVMKHQSLYSVIGTIYGGDGRTTFALPDLRGRTAVGLGAGPGLNPVQEGEKTSGIEGSVGSTGAGQAIRYVICASGIYPSRD